MDDPALVDVSVDVLFGNGYGLDQVASTLDTLDLVLTAGLLATEARVTGVDLPELLGRLAHADDELEIIWSIEFTESGSLRVRAIVRRVGGWASKHQTATIWVLGGVSVFAPVLGLSVWVPVGAWAAIGAVQATGIVHDRNLAQAQGRGPKAGTVPPPEIRLDVVPVR